MSQESPSQKHSHRPRGLFIAIEGPEGAGKSTQVVALQAAISSLGFRVVVTREPGGTAIGEQIRSVVLDQSNCAMLPATEVLLYAAARAQHVGEVLRPALESGAVVICDRYVDSTYAYQGGGRGLDMAMLVALQTYATGGLVPDVRVLLDLPVEIGLQRRLAHPAEINRFDIAEVEFHRRVRAAFLDLAAREPDTWLVIDASATPDRVTTAVLASVLPRLHRR